MKVYSLSLSWNCPRVYIMNRKGLHTFPVVPAMIYTNADLQKESIIKDNKGKAGIYRWTNKKNGKTYLGSAVNLTKRFYTYYNLKLITNSNMTICKALLKYGYSNFQLEILEYCEPENVLAREQQYLNHIKSEYNILRIAGSWFGHKHTEESLAKMSEAKKGNKHRLGKTHSEESNKKRSPPPKAPPPWTKEEGVV